MYLLIKLSTGAYHLRVAGPRVVPPALLPQGAVEEDHQEAAGGVVLSSRGGQAGQRVGDGCGRHQGRGVEQIRLNT